MPDLATLLELSIDRTQIFLRVLELIDDLFAGCKNESDLASGECHKPFKLGGASGGSYL